MAKDKRINDLPGISSAAMVALNGLGILTASDLVNADFDRVAFVLDDYNEATRLVREARRNMDQRKIKDAPAAPGPLASGTLSAPATRTAIRIGTNTPTPKSPRHQTHAEPAPAAQDQPMDQSLGLALTMAGASLTGADWRTTLSRRLTSISVLLEHDGTQHEIACALLLEPAEAGDLADPGISPELDSLLEECIALRAVPVLPSGRTPKYFQEVAASASASARRVCAAALIAAQECGGGLEDRSLLLLEALSTGSADPIVDLAGRSISRRAAA